MRGPAADPNHQAAVTELNHTVQLKEPSACTEGERRAFARLVRQGFATANEAIDSRVRDAKWLGFYYAQGGRLEAVAALKAPTKQYREEVFKKADAPVNPSDYPIELGWVFVVASHRGNRVGESLCRQLVERVPACGVFATTRTDNASMMRVLGALGFTRVGSPYQWRNEELVLFLRS
ncbi:MAG TPA: GNAT family N-acetyltransferase [Gemmatimonadales bacterium]|nr:GNAT family N-acetyltransferase [Gemmatimonadales bacterium]